MLNTFGPGSMEPSRSTGSANIPGLPKMEGFGSEELKCSPFNYGSVQDGMYGADTLEKKLKKQYWKAKQSVIEKLGKSQDEFVVAGDADIDIKLERAYHLGASCQELLQSLEKYSNRLQAVTNYELLMGEHLNVWSETEYTNAGEVMQKVGKLQQQDGKARLGLIPALMRIHQESCTFRESAIRDLAISIQLLEKARSEYRAALLWMKNVSMKLQNPDYRDQLAKFRESQATVKETKQKFERLKRDLSEKISMVSASRCNLLSRLLPIYQKEFLTFTDKWAGEYHKIMADLRSHHHHQYKLRNLMDEIRDLEVEEAAAFELPPPDTLQGGPSSGQLLDDDEPLIDMGGPEPTSPTGGQQQQKQEEEEESEQSFANSLLDLEREAKVNDLYLSGIEAELPALQELAGQQEDTQLQPPHPPPSSDTSTGEGVGNLLQLSPQHQTSSDSSAQDQTDKLFDEWSSFSILMPTAKSESSTSDWEKEFMQDTSDSTQDPLFGLDPLGSSSTVGQEKNDSATQSGLDALDLALHPTLTPAGDSSKPPVLSADSTLDELLGMREEQPVVKEGADLMAPSTTTAPPPSLPSPPTSDRGSELGSLDLAYFQEKPPPPTLPNPSLQPNQSFLLPTTMQQTQMLPSAPTFHSPLIAGQVPMFRSPLMTSRGPIFPPQQPLGGPTVPGSGGAQPLPKRGSKGQEVEKKESSWMNVFAHLDPLVNEKV